MVVVAGSAHRRYLGRFLARVPSLLQKQTRLSTHNDQRPRRTRPMLKNKSKSKFTYVPRTIDEVRKRSELASRFDNPFNPKFRKFKARQGDNTVRFLPATFQPGKHF